MMDFLKRLKPNKVEQMIDIQNSNNRTESANATVSIPAWVDPPSQTAVAIDTRDASNIAVIMEKETVEGDPVNKPNHYCKEGFELGEILYVWGTPHRRASAVEYIMRAGDKDPAKEVEDLKKAIRCLEMELAYMEKYGRRG